MHNTMIPNTGAALDAAPLPSEKFLDSALQGLLGLHAELLDCEAAVELREEPAADAETPRIVLAPTLTQQQHSLELLAGYRAWFDRVRPFLDRSPSAPTESFDEAFATLSSYFAMRRVGSGVTHAVWRELFALESGRLVQAQLEMLKKARECFALLNPQPRRTLENLQIRFIALGGDRYRVVAHSQRGNGETDLNLPFDERETENFVLRHCDPLRSAVRGWVPSSLRPYSDFGGRLFDALFTGAVRDLYMKHLAAVDSEHVGLRILLGTVAAPVPGGLPWEYLYDGREFLALTGSVSIVRHLEVDRRKRPLRVHGPLRVLVSASSPSDLAEIDAAGEVKALAGALAPLVSAGLMRLDIAPDGTINTLARMLKGAELAGTPYHVWHFLGHGRYLESEGGTYLAFENTNGSSQMHSGFELGTLLVSHPALRLAVLNACEGARSAPEDSLTSVGGALVARGMAASIAMQFSITDLAAVRFAEDFYRALADDGCVDTALADARRAIFFMPSQSEWATPVLMSRSEEPTLFQRS
jgi:hypothetical protein